jgi:hypothetical protein
VASFGSTGGTLFTFDGFNTKGNGIRFHNLRITYATSPSLPAMGPAVYLKSCENISFDQVYFSNCPGVLFDDNMSLQCGLTDCTIDYATGVNGQAMVTFSGSQDYVHNCVIRQAPGLTGPMDCTGIVITSASEAYVSNTHISDFGIGIDIQGGGGNPLHARFTNVDCEAWSYGARIRSGVAEQIVYQVFFSDCTFKMENGSEDLEATGIYIDTNGANNSYVSDIFISNCMCYEWNGPGLQINAGQNIVITGGRFGSNALLTSTSAGISITGTAANVTINGADCTPTVPGLSSQPYAIAISAAVAGLYLRGCNLTGYGTSGPLNLNSPGTEIEMTDCAGYNDLGTVLQTTPRTGAFSNTGAWTNAPNGWFGPVAFYVISNGDVSFGTNNTFLTQGEFTLSAGQTASIGGTIVHFLAIGK